MKNTMIKKIVEHPILIRNSDNNILWLDVSKINWSGFSTKNLDLIDRISPTRLIEKVNFWSCCNCIGFLEEDIKNCVFSEFCPLTVHFCTTMYQEIKFLVYWFEFIDNDIFIYCTTIGFQHLAFLSDFSIFIRVSKLGIDIHHGNENPFFNEKDNLSSFLVGHGRNKDLHKFDGTEFRQYGKNLSNSKRNILFYIVNCISVDLNMKKINRSIKSNDVANIFLRIILDKSNSYLKSLLELNNAHDYERRIIDEISSLRNTQKWLNKKRQEEKFKKSISVMSDQNVISYLKDLEKRVLDGGYVDKILNGDIKLPAQNRRIKIT